ncbi:hypothetical protein J1792_26910 [Streptomyces triculaminicus]|uniref:Phytanoyl-CoA dioxygenase n=2 Tax=Streptomyces TaxID=1883 RepID=A0A939FUL2_9ACTN|nr:MULTISPECIES: hypothetical protein [Streptomyces]MBO0656272.1 hypothetical protein [Streptomyces triculaminicus]QSY50256.1 hypothetical protein J3S04_04225 [Streptomyces griseocarneus]
MARGCGAEVTTAHLDSRTEVIPEAHLPIEWAAYAVRSPGLLRAVQDVIGNAVAVENTFLMVKWPGREFLVPWHQDGTNEHMDLDPERSVAAWPGRPARARGVAAS